jgi:integrase
MFTRTRFQTGSLKTEKRRRGPAVWVFRWRETDARGKRVKRKLILGTVEQYRSESHARRALAALDLELNEPKHKIATHPALMTVGQLVDHYEKEELGEERLSKTQGTVDVYREFLVYWIAPRWKAVRLTEIKPVEVERWLRSLNLANGTKAKIRNILSAVFQHALRHQFITANPIRGLVRQSAKREKEPDVLTAQEIGLILKRLPFRYRTLVFLAASTGLRFSEIRGLQWQDVDMATGTLNLKRGVVKHHVTPLKTKASRKPVPIHPALVRALQTLRAEGPYNQPADWVFASLTKGGKVPIWPTGVMADHVLPAVKAAKIAKRVSWHTFRHSYATMLKGNGEDVKTVQESLRHANSQIALDVYTQAIPQALRSAQAKVVDAIGAELIGPLMALDDAELSLSC